MAGQKVLWSRVTRCALGAVKAYCRMATVADPAGAEYRSPRWVSVGHLCGSLHWYPESTS